MRRLYNLQNKFYKRKFKEIYKVLFSADLDEISDHSTWFSENPDYIDNNKPLWIIAESKILNLRIWVCKDFGQLEISTATLDLPCNSNAYSDSFRHYRFNTQKEMVEFLEKLLEPCLENNVEQVVEDNEEEL